MGPVKSEPMLPDPGRFYELWHLRRLEIARSFCRTSGGLALDIGAGYGFLKSLGLDAVGVDVEHGSGVSVLASAEHLPFKEDTFDLIFAGEVIEHLNEPSSALTDWVRVLRVNGRLAMSTPNGILVGREGNNPQHRHVFAARDLKRSLKRRGISNIRTKTIFVGFVSGRRLFSLLPLRVLKVALIRFPVPSNMSFDLFLTGTKEHDAV